MILSLLKEIKKLKAAELKKLATRLEQIDTRPDTFIAKYLSEALHCCDYHFHGQNSDTEICPCGCYCKNCEFIPSDKIGIRMQEIANSIENDNTIPNLLRQKITIKEIDGKDGQVS